MVFEDKLKAIFAGSEFDYISINDYNNSAKPSLSRFVRFAPTPETDGYYRVGFLGKLRNPLANWEGYLPTITFFFYQLRRVGSFASTMVTSILPGADFSIISLILLILGFIVGIFIRLPIAIILTIVQLFVVLFASKNKAMLIGYL